MKRTKLFAILLVLIIAVCALSACGECAHEYEGGACSKCGDADPDYTPECVHEFANGGCTKCDELCECVFANGSCVFCNKACACDFENGTCKVCGKACDCKLENGACTVCGKACKCVLVNGACAICGKACDCNFENGACTICNKACDCSFYMGACTVCGNACECKYEQGVCTVCGAEDKTFDGRELYDDMIAKFKYLISYVKSNLELPEKEENPTVPNYDALYSVAGHYVPDSSEIGYAYSDINGDGLDELFLLGPDSRLYAIFTIINMAPVTVETFQNGLGYLYENEMVFYTVKVLDDVGQIKAESHFTYLVGDKLVGFAYGREDHDLDHDAVTEDIFYIISENGERTELAYDDYKTYSSYIYEYLISYATRVSKQSNLMFRSVFDTLSDATVTADFSTYDAIIKTFGLMHSSVAGGRYERSKFTSGKYDGGMIFSTEADFVIYNRLLAACTLSQNSSTATFGYAKRDLNGDGTEELILLEGNKYYVLAIFTEINGKPVLLDTYNDVKIAFIDAEGLIHVYERIIPGGKKDFEYFVYTVDNGKLAVVKGFGVKCDATGSVQEAWYEISGGKTADIAKIEFEALLEEYFLAVGTLNAANCAKYTKENSGLEFTLPTSAAE